MASVRPVRILPGATALQLTDRLGRSLVLSVAAALIGTVGGLVTSFELGWPAGPAIVLVMVGLFAASRLFSLGRRV